MTRQCYLNEFSPGDVVFLKSNGVKKVVERIHEGDFVNTVECRWWDGERFLKARFCPEELGRWSDPKGD